MSWQAHTVCGDTRGTRDLTCLVSAHCSVSLWPHFLSLYHLLSLFSVTWPLPLTPILWSYEGPHDRPGCPWIIPDYFSILHYIMAVTSLLLCKVTQPQSRMLLVFSLPTVCGVDSFLLPILIVCNTHVFVHSIVWVPGSRQASECGTKAFPPVVHSINGINRTEIQPALDSHPPAIPTASQVSHHTLSIILALQHFSDSTPSVTSPLNPDIGRTAPSPQTLSYIPLNSPATPYKDNYGTPSNICWNIWWYEILIWKKKQKPISRDSQPRCLTREVVLSDYHLCYLYQFLKEFY